MRPRAATLDTPGTESRRLRLSSPNLHAFRIGSLAAIAALLLSACGITRPPVVYPPASAPGYNATPIQGYGYRPGGMMGGVPGGMMGGWYGIQSGTPAPGYGYGPGGMMGGVPNGMMGGYGYGQYAPTAQPTPVGATPAPVDEEIQITAENFRFDPATITVNAGETVRFTIVNQDGVPHNFVSQDAAISYTFLPAGATQTVTWTAPATEGRYTAVCTFHPGMSLTIVVKD